MEPDSLKALVVDAIEERKGQNIVVLDVRLLTEVTDWMVVVSGGSSRQVRAIAENVAERVKAAGEPIGGIEGEPGADWVLVDLYGVVVHVMLPETREFYRIEDLWSLPVVSAESAETQ
ncbi:MAG: ribosome silencing factor [Gammaproteobacteria bacterium]|nr:ribosome silencing factor [Gammaproteobacteria bacterium]